MSVSQGVFTEVSVGSIPAMRYRAKERAIRAFCRYLTECSCAQGGSHGPVGDDCSTAKMTFLGTLLQRLKAYL